MALIFLLGCLIYGVFNMEFIKFQDDFYNLLEKHGIKNINNDHEKFEEILILRNSIVNFIENTLNKDKTDFIVIDDKILDVSTDEI